MHVDTNSSTTKDVPLITSFSVGFFIDDECVSFTGFARKNWHSFTMGVWISLLPTCSWAIVPCSEGSSSHRNDNGDAAMFDPDKYVHEPLR